MKTNACYLSHMVYGNVLPTDVFIGYFVGSARLGESSQDYRGMKGTEIDI